MSGKKRSDNYTEDERMAVINMVKTHAHVIEDKKNDSKSTQRKQSAWETIAKQIVALFPGRANCTTKDLKELWRRMKTKAKSLARAKKIDIVQTGGGKSVVGDLSEEVMSIMNIITGDLEQYRNSWDDDAQEAVSPIPHTPIIPVDAGPCSPIPSTSTSDLNRSTTTILVNADVDKDSVIVHDAEDSSPNLQSEPNRKPSSACTTPVLKKADEARIYLKIEHDAKMMLITLQQEAARSKKKAYDAKTEYYNDKRRKLCNN